MDTNNDETVIATESNAISEQSEKPISAEEEFFDDSNIAQQEFDNAENDDGNDQRFQAANRGGFRLVSNHKPFQSISFKFKSIYRGRWNAGAISPRFRGRGFAPNQMCQPIRRGNPQFFRGGRAAAPRNFQDPNWNAPPMYV